MTLTVGQQVDVLEPGRIRVRTEIERPGRRRPGLAPAGRDAVGELGDLGERSEGEAAEVHPQNALGVAGVRGAAEDQRRGSLGSGESQFLSGEIALGVGAVSVEVRVVAEAVLVAGGGEGIIGNSGFTERVVAGKNREGRRKRRIKNVGRRWSFPGNFAVALNPRQLAAGVQHHLLRLRRRPHGERNDQRHGILERRSVLVRLGIWVLRDQRRREN